MKKFTGNIREDKDWEDAVNEFIEAKKISDEADLKTKEAKARLIKLADGTPSKGNGILVNSSSRKGTIKYAQIVKDYMGVLENAGMKIDEYTGGSSVVWSVSADRIL